MSLIISGVIDGPLSGGVPKAVELYATADIADLSIYGLESANNGGASGGEEFTFPSVSATAGDYIYVASESTGFTSFFGFAPDYTSSALSINGDDAILLFQNGSVIDVFGEVGVDGTGEPWEHTDGWAYRDTGTGPDGATFDLANWSFSGTDALDSETSNATAATPFPTGTFLLAAPAPSIVINEVLFDPATGIAGDANGDGIRDAANDEFVEIVNTGAGPLDISGWTLSDDDGDDFAFPGGTLLAAGQAAVLFGGGTPTGAFGGALVFTDDGSIGNGLSNSGDLVELRDDTGTLIDSVGYGGAGAVTGGSDQSITRDPDLTGGFADHTGATGSGGAAFSPGTRIDGTPFGGAAAPTLAIDDVQAVEGDSGTTDFTFTVTLTGAASGPFTVDVATADGTATAGSDYTAASDTLSFAGTDGETQSFTVSVLGDTAPEPDETFTATLSGVTGAADVVIGTATGTGTVENDDGLAITRIHTIQGSPATQLSNPVSGNDNMDGSPLDGQIVTVEAIVVGDFQDGDADTTRNLRGFYIQEEDGDADGDAATSEGIFVFENGDFITDVAVGDLVRVTGTVDEFFGETQLDTITDITVVSSSNPLPSAASITLPSAATSTAQDGDLQADLEAFEGMRVTFPDTLTVTEMFQLDRFNEIKLSQGGRLDQFTQNNAPSVAGFQAHLADIAARTITYDDGENRQNELIGQLDGFGPTFSTATDIRMGDTIDNLSGVLSYQWAGASASQATWRVRAAEDGENAFDKVNARPATPEDVGGSIQVASLNVLNYFTTIDDGSSTTDNGLGPRGADDLTRFGGPAPAGTDPTAEFDRQTEKLVTQILGIGADIFGLVELENSNADTALANLVNELNAVAGAGTYDFVATPGLVGTDAITTGFIYTPDTVSLVGNPAILDSSDFTDPNATGQDRNRPAVAQTFEEIATGERFTAAVNHFKSKGDSGLEGGPLANPDVDQGDGQGFWNDTRTDAAIALADWLATDPTGASDPDFMIMGDLNAYAEEDPITALEGLGYTDLAASFLTDPYSFVFDGQRGTLDYILVNDSLFAQVTDATEWHVNADEPDAIDYNLDFGRDSTIFDGSVPWRGSDHDPVITGLSLQSGGGAKTVISATNGAGFDNLQGSDDDEIFVFDGGVDIATTGGGADDLDLSGPVANPGRDNVVATDFDPTEDAILGISETDVLRAFELSSRTLLVLDSGDLVSLIGVSDADSIVYADDLGIA